MAALQCLVERGINLARLDSRPLPDRTWQYRCSVDFEVDDPSAANAAVEALRRDDQGQALGNLPHGRRISETLRL